MKRVLWILLLIGLGITKAFYRNERREERRQERKEAIAQIKTAIDTAIAEEEKKRQDFDGATVVIHQAAPYQGVPPYPIGPEERLVAMDVEFQNVGLNTDLNELEVIDGANGEYCGSEPDMVGLTPDGSNLESDPAWPKSLGHFRGMFIYPLPKTTNQVRLSYWGRTLTLQATPVSEKPILALPANIKILGNRRNPKTTDTATIQ